MPRIKDKPLSYNTRPSRVPAPEICAEEEEEEEQEYGKIHRRQGGYGRFKIDQPNAKQLQGLADCKELQISVEFSVP